MAVTSDLISMIKNRLNREEIYSTAAYWDAKAHEYEGDAASMWPNRSLNAIYNREQRQLLTQVLGNVQGKTLMDLGCGTGRNSRYLASLGAQVTGVDFSAQAIEVAKRSSTDYPNLQYRVESIFDLNEPQKYDYILSWGVVTVAAKNGQELGSILANINRSLKPGGQVLFFEPIHSGPLHRVLNLSLPDFLTIVKQQSFSVDQVEALHFWPTRLMLCYVNLPAWLTNPVAGMGTRLMKAFNNKGWGDYKFIRATRHER